MSEQEPQFVYQSIFQAFTDFAKAILADKAEPLALILVAPWMFEAKYPPGAVVTRSGSLSMPELLASARQLREMSDRLYQLAERELAEKAKQLEVETKSRAEDQKARIEP